MTLAEARRQHEIVRVANARLRYDKEMGKLVYKDKVIIAIHNRTRKEQNAHFGWVMRASPLMAVDLCVNPTLMFTVLDRHVREHLKNLAKIPIYYLHD